MIVLKRTPFTPSEHPFCFNYKRSIPKRKTTQKRRSERNDRKAVIHSGGRFARGNHIALNALKRMVGKNLPEDIIRRKMRDKWGIYDVSTFDIYNYFS